jgi:hypothetical protein
VISTDLGRALRDHGLAWHPADGDRFVLPGRGMDDRVFTISEMVVEVRSAPAGRIIAFNGTTEWALDAIEQAEAIWLPRESQLRESLGDHLLSLARVEGGRWRVTLHLGEGLEEFEAADADVAYATALLAILDR